MVCKGMKFSRFPLDEHVCYLMLTSCKLKKHILNSERKLKESLEVTFFRLCNFGKLVKPVFKVIQGSLQY